MKADLSQDEVDAILNGGKAPDQTSEGPKRFALGADSKIIRGQMPFLDSISETFSRNLQRRLNDEFGFNCTISSTEVKTIKMGELLKRMTFPSSLNIVKIPPLSGQSLVALEAKLVYDLLNQQYGGNTERSYKLEGKTFTQLEMMFINNILQHIYKEMEVSWSSILNVNVEHQFEEMNPKHAMIISPNESIVVMRARVVVDNREGAIDICIPSTSLNPHIKELEQTYMEYQGRDLTNWTPSIKEDTKKIFIDLQAPLVKELMPYNQVADLSIGDKIEFNKPQFVILYSNDIPIAKCAYGTDKNNNLCLKVIETFRLPRESNDE